MSQEITPYASVVDLHYAVVVEFCELAKAVVKDKGVFRVSLSGGSTPKKIYEMLATRDLPWDSIHWFWGDERNVSHEDEQSNFRMVRAALLNNAPIPSENVHAVPVSVSSPGEASAQYDSHLREVFAGEDSPSWDLVLLGMGDDAHTASLFPETEALGNSDRWFIENWVPKFDAYRYTLTATAINSGVEKWFLVAGEAKRVALAHVLGEPRNTSLYPSQLIEPTRWFVTQDAWS